MADTEDTAKFEHPLIDQITAYHRMEEELEHNHHGRWVIIHESRLAGDYDSFLEAEEAAAQMGLNTVECLFQQVGMEPAIIIPMGRKRE